MSTAIHYATGRRKTSSARVYLSKGKGKILVNDKELSHYFGRQVAQMLVMQPLRLTELEEKNDGEFIGFKNNESCIFINENNYKNKFEEFLSDPDNTKWEEIATLGRDFAMNELNNDNAVETIVDSIKKLIK